MGKLSPTGSSAAGAPEPRDGGGTSAENRVVVEIGGGGESARGRLFCSQSRDYDGEAESQE